MADAQVDAFVVLEGVMIFNNANIRPASRHFAKVLSDWVGPGTTAEL
jgi:hypothetical protein